MLMLSKEMIDALNEQINMELYSAYAYAAMASYFENKALKGFAHWMHLQTDEEIMHARKLRAYLHDRGAAVTFAAIDAPQVDWKTPLDVFEAALGHERKVTESINKLSTLSVKQNDHATHALLEWFVAEQVEEEANADQVVQQLKLVEGAPGGLFLLDREMAQRQADPAAGDAS
jgi:ferritin